MRLRKWISLVALLGVLVHAGALVRHHGVMVGALLQYNVLVSDLSASCHGGTDQPAPTPVDLPSIPKPSDAKNGCPICSGQGLAFAVLAPVSLEVPNHPWATSLWSSSVALLPAPRHAVCPPARGPPATTRSV